MVLAQLEQRQLLGGLFGLRPTDDNEPIELGPLGRLVAELGHLDASAGTGVPQVRELAFDRGRQAGDDHKAGPPSLQPLDEFVVVKPFVGAENRQPDPSRPLRETRRQQVEHPRGGMGVAGAQLPVPKILGLPLETQQGMIGGAAPLEGVVADPRLFLPAIDDQHRGIDIEDQPRRRSRASGHPLQEAIVQPAQLRKRRRRNPEQKPPYRGGVRIGAQPGEILEDAVQLQQLGRLDPFESEDHRIEHGQKHLPHAVTIVALHEAEVLRQRVFESDACEKPMEKVHAAIVGQRLGTKGDTKCARSLGHPAEPYLIGRVQRNGRSSGTSAFLAASNDLASTLHAGFRFNTGINLFF